VNRTDHIKLVFEVELKLLLGWYGAGPGARRHAETIAEADREVLLGYGREVALT
jgi:hypothetical protein